MAKERYGKEKKEKKWKEKQRYGKERKVRKWKRN